MLETWWMLLKGNLLQNNPVFYYSMLFNSFEFLIFLPVVVLVYYIIPNNNY